MTPTELRLWTAVVRRAGLLTPDLAARILAAFQILRDNLSDADFEKAVDTGYAEQIVAQLIDDAKWQAAMQPVRDVIRRSLVQSVTYYTRNTMPLPPATAKEITIAFDYLSPRVIDAIRTLESRVITSLEAPIRETLRATVEQGLKDGVSARTMAQNVRDVFGLAPSQAQEVLNFRDALAGVNGRSITDYNLRNRTVDRLLAKGPLTQEQIDRYTEIYRKRRIAQNAYTNAHTAALDAQKLANRLSWENAATQGVVDRSRLVKTWRGVMDDRERPLHVKQEGVTVGFDEPFPTGEMIPGTSVYNCRCVAVYRVRAA